MDGVQGQTIPKYDVDASHRKALCNSHLFSLHGEALPGVPAFQPARGLSSAHAQTAWATLFPGLVPLVGTTERRLRLDDGDLVVMHDDCPSGWRRGDHVVLMQHGLGGSHRSGYMVRLAAKLQQRCVRTFRMDHRGCGAGTVLQGILIMPDESKILLPLSIWSNGCVPDLRFRSPDFRSAEICCCDILENSARIFH